MPDNSRISLIPCAFKVDHFRFMSLKKIILCSLLTFISTRLVLAQEEPEDLQPSTRELEIQRLSTITITANPLAPTLLEYGNAVTFLDAEQLKPKAEMSLGESLNLTPGVTSSFGGTGASRPVIRGFAGDRIRILRNGLGTMDVSGSSEDHATTINPLAVETIEILRGPETLLYGSSAIGGVINTTDGTIPEAPIGKPLTGSLDLRARTNDEELSGATKLEGQSGQINWHFDGFHFDTEDYQIPGKAHSRHLEMAEDSQGSLSPESDNTLQNTFSTTKGLTIGGSYLLKNGFFGVALNTFNSRYGVPGHTEHDNHDNDSEEEHDLSEDQTGSVIDLSQHRLDTRAKLKDPNSLFKEANIKLSFSNYDHSESEADDIATRYSNNAVEGRIDARHQDFHGIKGSLGIQNEFSDLTSDGLEAYLPSNKRYSPAFFVYESIPVTDKTRFQAGSRIEYVYISPDLPDSATFVPLSLSSGLFYDPTGDSAYTVSLSAAYTERAPSAAELYADGIHFARQIAELGDSNIGKERSYGLDLNLKKNMGIITSGISLFAQRYENFINLEPSNESRENFPVYSYEEVPALFTGTELETTFHLHELLDLYTHELDLGAQLDYVRARTTDDYSNIPRIPPLRTVLNARYAYKDIFSGLIEGVFANSQTNTAENELITDSYQVLNTQIDFHLPNLKNKIGSNFSPSFYIRGTNLTDEEVRLSTSFIKDVAPLRGRAILFGLRLLF